MVYKPQVRGHFSHYFSMDNLPFAEADRQILSDLNRSADHYTPIYAEHDSALEFTKFEHLLGFQSDGIDVQPPLQPSPNRVLGYGIETAVSSFLYLNTS